MPTQGSGEPVAAARTPPRTPHGPPPGLCGNCRHVQVIETRKGSRFFRCRLSERDPRFPRYPRLPVLACPGWSRQPDSGADARPAATDQSGGEADSARDDDPAPGR